MISLQDHQYKYRKSNTFSNTSKADFVGPNLRNVDGHIVKKINKKCTLDQMFYYAVFTSTPNINVLVMEDPNKVRACATQECAPL